MSSNVSEQPLEQRIESLSALLTHLKGDESGALSELEGKTDAESIRRKLDILINAGKYQKAAEAIRQLEPERIWCDAAVLVLTMNSELRAAKAIVEWARKDADRSTWRRCSLMYGKGRYLTALERLGADQPVLPGDLTDEEMMALRDCIAAFEPTLHTVLGNEKIDTEVEADTVQIALHAASLTGDHSRSIQLSKLLETRTPISLALPRFVQEHIVAPPPDLADRLRAELPDSFAAKASAVILDSADESKREASFLAAKDLLRTATDDKDRESAIKILNEIAQHLNSEALAEVDVLVATFLEPTNRFRKLTRLDRLIRGKKLDEAHDLLELLKDEEDPFWLQLYGNYRLQLGDGRSAADYFAKASITFPHPIVLRTAASIALDFGRLSVAQSVLERLLSREPDALPQRKTLAFVYTEENLFEKAAEEFLKLRQREPGDLAHTHNLALCLWRAGKLDDALKAFDHLCTVADAPLRAVVGRAELLKDLNRASEGYDWLVRYKDAFWDDYRFVQVFLDLAGAAQHDEVLGTAVARLRELQAQSKAPPEILQAGTLEDLKGFILKHRENLELVCRLILQNRVPWLFADKVLRHPAYWAWAIRTQTLNWLSDDSIERSQFTVYSTNGYFVKAVGGPDAALEEISVPPAGGSVVVDISALITLNELSLLDEAIQYFGTIQIPAVYMSTAVSELRRLQSHQPSVRAALQEIKNGIRSKSVHLAREAGSVGARPYPYVNEHTLDDDKSEHYYRLVDLLGAAQETGGLSDSSQKKLIAVAHKPSGVDSEHQALADGEAILVELSTLRTISQVGALAAICKSFKVHLDPASEGEIDQELRAHEFQDEVRSRHLELWDRVRGDSQILQQPLELPPEFQDREDETTFSLISALLANERKLPLYADDRALQSLVLNGRSTEPGTSFGSDAFLKSLFAAQLISLEKYHEGVLRLMKWRYRFLVPDAAMLLEFAAAHASRPPGEKLLTVARYVQDSMQDAGLLAGFEPTNPPTTIAARIFLSVTGAVSEFIIDAWTDPRFSDESALAITKWAVSEMLPCPPRNMGSAGSQIATLSRRVILSRALIRACLKKDTDRANRGLWAIAEALEVSESDFWKTTTEIIGAS